MVQGVNNVWAVQGRLTLLMGPPRSGKSLFMHLLAGAAATFQLL